jgi:hypothetical protein
MVGATVVERETVAVPSVDHCNLNVPALFTANLKLR